MLKGGRLQKRQVYMVSPRLLACLCGRTVYWPIYCSGGGGGGGLGVVSYGHWKREVSTTHQKRRENGWVELTRLAQSSLPPNGCENEEEASPPPSSFPTTPRLMRSSSPLRAFRTENKRNCDKGALEIAARCEVGLRGNVRRQKRRCAV